MKSQKFARAFIKVTQCSTSVPVLVVIGIKESPRGSSVGQSTDFWDFSAKKDFFDIAKWHHLFMHFPRCGQAQLYQVWWRFKEGFQISKRLFTDRFEKNLLLAIIFSLLETRTQFSEYPSILTWQHGLISLIWPQEQYPIIKITQYESQGSPKIAKIFTVLLHKFKHSFQDSLNPLCLCSPDIESTIHYFQNCPLFINCKHSIVINEIDNKLLNDTDSNIFNKFLSKMFQ